MMPEFLQKFAKVLPLYYVNEGLRASMVAADHMAALKCALIIGAFAGVVFVLGIMITKLDGETT
jgi:ABC-2 type transport system permease protein